MVDLVQHLTRQAVFSRLAFGPGPRTEGVSQHIRKELEEVAEATPDACYDPCSGVLTSRRAREWVDVAILGLDGLLRQLWDENPGCHAEDIAALAHDLIVEKQGRNEKRDWGHVYASQDEAVEHKREPEEV